MGTKTPYRELKKKMKNIMLLNQTASLLGWDNQTYMPSKGINQRAQQLALLSEISHNKLVNPKIGQLIKKSKKLDNISKIQMRDVELWRREYEKQVNIPTDLVQKLSKQRTLTEHSWREAKQKSNFSMIRPKLEKLYELVKQMAVKLNENKSPYNNLLDYFEPRVTESMISSYFSDLKEGVLKILKKYNTISIKPDPNLLKIKATDEQQLKLGRFLMKSIGLTEDRSRLDSVVHPFTTGAYDDVRITTHLNESSPMVSLFAVVHESGHALYELNMPKVHQYTAIGTQAGLGIHESQSRFVENIIGRNPKFLSYLLPNIKNIIPGFNNISIQDFIKSINIVTPSKIRILADEITYSLHIILRFEIEKMLFNDKITISELPQVWNEKIKEYLGLNIENDAEGVLQDTHWYGGMFGYFPDYALGNIYSGQFLWKMEKEIPDWENNLKTGDCSDVIGWLSKNIHMKGSLYDPTELVEKVTGYKPDPKYYLDYLDKKYKNIFNY